MSVNLIDNFGIQLVHVYTCISNLLSYDHFFASDNLKIILYALLLQILTD